MGDVTDMSYGMPPYGGHMEPPNMEELQDFVARAGEPLEPGIVAANHETVVEALRSVYDPEIPVNIYELGLIYKIEVDEKNKVNVDMTLTSPNCPVAESLPNEVKENIKKIDGVSDVDLNLVWEPPWDKDKMSEAAKLELNL